MKPRAEDLFAVPKAPAVEFLEDQIFCSYMLREPQLKKLQARYNFDKLTVKVAQAIKAEMFTYKTYEEDAARFSSDYVRKKEQYFNDIKVKIDYDFKSIKDVSVCIDYRPKAINEFFFELDNVDLLFLKFIMFTIHVHGRGKLCIVRHDDTAMKEVNHRYHFYNSTAKLWYSNYFTERKKFYKNGGRRTYNTKLELFHPDYGIVPLRKTMLKVRTGKLLDEDPKTAIYNLCHNLKPF